MENLTKEQLLELLTDPHNQVEFDEVHEQGFIDLVVTVPSSEPMGRPSNWYITLAVDVSSAVKSSAD